MTNLKPMHAFFIGFLLLNTALIAMEEPKDNKQSIQNYLDIISELQTKVKPYKSLLQEIKTKKQQAIKDLSGNHTVENSAAKERIFYQRTVYAGLYNKCLKFENELTQLETMLRLKKQNKKGDGDYEDCIDDNDAGKINQTIADTQKFIDESINIVVQLNEDE